MSGSDNGLDFVGVDQSGEIGVSEEGSFKNVSLLSDSGGGEGSEDVVKSFEGGSGPDNESSEVTSGGELEEIESINMADFNSGNVSSGLSD